MTDQEPIKSPSIPADRYQYEIPKIQQVFCHWWKTRQSVLGDFSPKDAAFEAFKFGIYEEGKGTFDPEPCQQVPTDEEITTLSYEFSDEVETGDDYFMTVVDPVGFARAVLERWGRQGSDSTVWHSKKARDKNKVWYDKVEEIDKSIVGTPARVEMNGTFTKAELLEIAEVLKEESNDGY